VAATGPAAAIGAGGGVASGTVYHGTNPPTGSVLVVPFLDPGLAPLVPRLAAIVAETGSPLSHLAILARENGVAVVVGAQGATARWPDGQQVLVHGDTGEIEIVLPGGEATVEPSASMGGTA
jgi:pyruvate,water dikinase